MRHTDAPTIALIGREAESRALVEGSGLHVLSATGVQSETHLPFAGFHQLLRPILHDVDRLPAPYAKVIHGAFGLHDEPVSFEIEFLDAGVEGFSFTFG